MSQATVLRYGELKGPAKAWLTSLFGENASDDAVVRISIGEPAEEEWSPTMNERRRELIKRDIDGTITREESLELEYLQEAMRAHVRKVAPIPLEEARELHSKLVAKAAKNGRK
jgi:hypothetical protein